MTPQFLGSSIFTNILAISPILFLMLNQFIWKTSVATVATLSYALCTQSKRVAVFPADSRRYWSYLESETAQTVGLGQWLLYVSLEIASWVQLSISDTGGKRNSWIRVQVVPGEVALIDVHTTYSAILSLKYRTSWTQLEVQAFWWQLSIDSNMTMMMKTWSAFVGSAASSLLISSKGLQLTEPPELSLIFTIPSACQPLGLLWVSHSTSAATACFFQAPTVWVQIPCSFDSIQPHILMSQAAGACEMASVIG